MLQNLFQNFDEFVEKRPYLQEDAEITLPANTVREMYELVLNAQAGEVYVEDALSDLAYCLAEALGLIEKEN